MWYQLPYGSIMMMKPSDAKDAVSALELAATKTNQYLKGAISGEGTLSAKLTVSREIRSLDPVSYTHLTLPTTERV